MNEEELTNENELEKVVSESNASNEDSTSKIEGQKVNVEATTNGIEALSTNSIQSGEEKIVDNNITDNVEEIGLETADVVLEEKIAEVKEVLPEIEIEKDETTTILDNTSTIDVTDIDVQMDEEILKEQPESAENKRKKSKAKIVIPIILLLIIGAVAVWYFIFNNSKNLFLAAINKEYNLISNKIDEKVKNDPLWEKAKESSYNVNGTFNFKASGNVGNDTCYGAVNCTSNEPDPATILNKINGSFAAGLDYKNKKSNIQLNLKYNEKDLLNFGMYIENKNAYLEIKELFDKYITMPYEEFDAIFENPDSSYDDSKYLIDTLKNTVLESLDSKDFKQTSVDIFIGDKKVKTKKISYELTQEKFNELAEKVRQKLIKDDKFMEKLVSVTGSKDIKIKMEEPINQEVTDTRTKIIFAIYNKGFVNETVRFDVAIKDDNNDYELSYTRDNKNKYIRLINGEETVISAVIKEENENKSSTKIEIGTDDDMITVDVDKIKENNKTTYNYKISDKDKTVSISGKLVHTSDKKDTSEKEKITFDMKITSSGETINLGFEVEAGAKVGEEVKVPKIGQTMTLDEISTLDSTDLLLKVIENETLMELLTDLGMN